MPANEIKNSKENTVLKVISRENILLLYATFMLFLAFMVWFVFGTIKLSFTYRGILTVKGDAVTINQPDEVVVTDCLVHPIQFVKKGDVLLRVFPMKDKKNVSLKQMSLNSHNLTSPVDGFVTEINVTQWTQANLSTVLMWIMPNQVPSISYALTYVPIDEIDRIKIGMHTSIRTEGSDDISHNVLKGEVIKISNWPVSKYHMHRSIGSEDIARYFYQEQIQQYEVLIKLDNDIVNSRRATLVCNKMCRITFFTDEIPPYRLIYNN